MVVVVVGIVTTTGMPSAKYAAGVGRQAGQSANAVDHARHETRATKTAGRAEKVNLDIETDIDTFYPTLFRDLTQVHARNTPELLGDPGRDVTEPFHRLLGAE